MRAKGSGPSIPTAVSSRRNPRSAPCIWETVFVVATHPESDRASTRVQLFSATRGKDFCRAVFPSLRSGGLVHLHRRVQAVGSGCCRDQQRRSLGRLSEHQLPAEDAGPAATLRVWPNQTTSTGFWVVSAHPGQPRCHRNNKDSPQSEAGARPLECLRFGASAGVVVIVPLLLWPNASPNRRSSAHRVENILMPASLKVHVTNIFATVFWSVLRWKLVWTIYFRVRPAGVNKELRESAYALGSAYEITCPRSFPDLVGVRHAPLD